MTIDQFIAKWKKAELKERAAAQEHFIDLCRLVGHPTPAEADATGSTFCFEKGAAKYGGGDGFADVWKQGFFGWEYKGKRKDLEAAFDQLLRYKDALENPPLLVTCDLDRFVIRTNFTYTAPDSFEFRLDEMAEPRNIEILRAVFFNPEALKPGKTSQVITQEAAERFAAIAEAMRQRGLDSARVAHFLDRVVFCLFAEDVNLLPDKIFTRIVEKAGGDPVKFGRLLGQLFAAMVKGGEFGLESIKHFNGNLFDDAWMPELTVEDVKRITDSTALDWSAVDPSIFGTLFERGLDPSKRSQLGAHFTSKADIELLVDAVVMQPLRQEWAEVRQTIECLLTTGKKKPGPGTTKRLNPAELRKASRSAESLLHQFLVRLWDIKVLDPACGSGNFLYVTLQKLKDLEKEVILFSTDNGLGAFLPLIGPWQLRGIEVNSYAFDLAQMTVWIGWLQWIRANGFGFPSEPILRPLGEDFQCRDAILDLSDPAKPKEPDWPKVDFIVGNPPFLGSRFLRRELGDEYVNRMLSLWRERVTAEADLCCYWFEKARHQIETGQCKRAGLLATQGIRGSANREVLKRIQDTGEIFWAISDKEWILDGANVHVSLIGFDDGSEKTRVLDGTVVSTINVNLSTATDITQARILPENQGIAFMGDTKVGSFEIPEALAQSWLPLRNPNGRPNAEVVRPWANGLEITRTPQRLWIVDFPLRMSETEAAQYEVPFEYIREHVKPTREANRRALRARRWWIHAETAPAMRKAFNGLSRFLVTPRVSKHRIFAWLNGDVLPDCQLIVFARADDYFFGILHSRIHEVWARSQGTQLREKESGFRYTPTTCFETFPFPKPTPSQEQAIAEAALALEIDRQNWLGDRSDKKRTLTALYNQRPTWLTDTHTQLDAAVCAAYGWEPTIGNEEILRELLALNVMRATPNSPTPT
ncbi:MAG: class I SAM-dependent DNA methyltransferase [candidate division NC10 bacterium]|nr:class I SAM-dependent DNA methyltransferase [candidate division NC10 bacterium]